MANPFDRYADRYDAWFESPVGRAIFRAEVRCIEPLLSGCPEPRLEVGVGTGRFARSLRISHGVDPADAALRRAEMRGIEVTRAPAEALPFDDGAFSAVAMIVTVMFVDDPAAGFREAARVLRGDGCLIVGDVDANSPWGRAYIRDAMGGHPFFSHATFFTPDQIVQMAVGAGFELAESRSALPEGPEELSLPIAEPVDGMLEDYGFKAMKFLKTGV